MNVRDFKKNMRGKSEILDRISGGALSAYDPSLMLSNNNDNEMNDDSRVFDDKIILKESLQDQNQGNTIKFKNPFFKQKSNLRNQSMSSLSSLISEDIDV